MDEKFRQLIELGAGEFEHIDGSLIAHLEGTMCLLKSWNAPEPLQDAGLYHAAYGSKTSLDDEFESSQREEIAMIIGLEVENIVYHYCACDKDVFLAQFGKLETPVFYNRITKTKSTISFELLQQLCELTAANEVDIAINNPTFIEEHGSGLFNLFRHMQPFLSLSAQRKVQHVFAPIF